MNQKLSLLGAAGAALVITLASSTALAQPGGGPPPPPPGYGAGGGGYGYAPPAPPPMNRHGLIFGASLGIGGMDSDQGIDCFGCDYTPVAGGISGHIGFMINPRTALVLELQGTFQSLDADGFAWLAQTSALGAIQYFVSPKLWLKGGLGFSSLSIQYDDGFASEDEVGSGGAFLAAAGYEVLQIPHPMMPMSLDLQFRFTAAGYEGLVDDSGVFDDTVYSGIFAIGLNWY